MSQRVALISDIHANLPALEAVLRDIDSQQVAAIYCLGDVVGYGPQPAETLERVIAVTQPGKAIAGNHDYAVLVEAIGFNRSAREAVDWTRELLRPRWFEWGKKRRHWQWLKQLPTIFEEGDVSFVHASPRQHLEEYILEEHTQGMSYLGEDPETMLDENFQLVQRVCFIGHTHRPGVITADYQWHTPADHDQRWTLDSDKVIVNIGSVGQPRDKDPRACYAIYDGESVEWRRVEYDIGAVQRIIEANTRLDNRLGDRLREGR